MSELNWNIFYSLPGSKNINFENLCRGIVRFNFGAYGNFKALKNQPGVEFHLDITKECLALGDTTKWFGWQCKVFERNAKGELNASSKQKITESLEKTKEHLENLTDWVLWTPYNLTKQDQEWFYSLKDKYNYNLHLWTDEEVDNYLCGPALYLKETYFGDLILTPEELKEKHNESIQVISDRWLAPVHQSVEIERKLRRMLGEKSSWEQMPELGNRLKEYGETIATFKSDAIIPLENELVEFNNACKSISNRLIGFHEVLSEYDLDIIKQFKSEINDLITNCIRTIPRKLRKLNLPITIEATNALDDMHTAKSLIDEANDFLDIGLVAVIAEAGVGKTHISSEITSSNGRPAGILLFGSELSKGQNLNHLASNFSINGKPLDSMENLLAALDSAGKRAKCRLPIIIDGLNEAEDPRDWKNPLAKLNETVKKYPNVLVICTLRKGEVKSKKFDGTETRENFAYIALPEDIRSYEYEGFERDTNEAIEKYFKYFKIDSGDIEIPVEFFNHPLTLRIFCEVTNPKRDYEVKVDSFPCSIYPLFDKYIEGACERISLLKNINYSYDELKLVLYHLGKKLWELNRRQIKENEFKNSLSDLTLNWEWDKNVINLFAREGIIFRNPSKELGKFLIMPVYDTLGGYIIANSIFEEQKDNFFNLIQTQDFVLKFKGENSHQLYSDIFKALVLMSPIRLKNELMWKKIHKDLKRSSLIISLMLEGKYLDQDTINEFIKLIKEDLNVSERILSRLFQTRAINEHPLNSEFLSLVLGKIQVSERDLFWTEWVRRAKVAILDDLLELEFNWKQNKSKRSKIDTLKAKWVIWLLTSTDHELRDIATRALYWFGWGTPEELFKDSLNFLNCNDSYVSERLLAASYGVAMSLHTHTESNEFVEKILPWYSKELYNQLFTNPPKIITSHLMLKDYASRIIELNIFHNPDTFSKDEIKRISPPYDLKINWGNSSKNMKEYSREDSPISLDFENYTLGSLVKDRSPYEFKNKKYQNVCSKVLWRIKQLGWSSDKFKKVDGLIENENWRKSSTEASNKRIDRYGKKYSWIAYYEMTGYLQDRGELEDWGERYECNIDPSFTERVPNTNLFNFDFLDSDLSDTDKWIKKKALPKITPFFKPENILSEQEQWILLDGSVFQENKKLGRRIQFFIRSLLIKENDKESISNLLFNKYNKNNYWLPDKPNSRNIYAGEIPWCDTFSNNNFIEISLINNEEKIKVKRKKNEFYINGNKVEFPNIKLIRNLIIDYDTGKVKEKDETDFSEIEQIQLREEEIEVDEIKYDYKYFEIFIPVRDISWNSHETVTNEVGLVTTLAKEISSELELVSKPQTFNLFTKDDKVATVVIKEISENSKFTRSLLYIKESLLKKYLDNHNLKLLWHVTGERGYSLDRYEKHFPHAKSPQLNYSYFNNIDWYEK